MKTLDVKIVADAANIRHAHSKRVEVELENINLSSLLEHVSISDILDFFDEDEILETIGENKAIQYFKFELR